MAFGDGSTKVSDYYYNIMFQHLLLAGNRVEKIGEGERYTYLAILYCAAFTGNLAAFHAVI